MKQINSKKLLPSFFSIFFFTSFLLCNQRTTALISVCFTFLFFFLNRATGGFIFWYWKIFNIVLKVIWPWKIAETLVHKFKEQLKQLSVHFYFATFFWKTGLLILAFKCDIYGRVFSRPCRHYDKFCIRYHEFQKTIKKLDCYYDLLIRHGRQSFVGESGNVLSGLKTGD